MHTCRTIALYQNGYAFELLADGIVTARKHVDRQVLADLAETGWIGQLGCGGEERFTRSRL
jgi:hypothetical protein